MAPAGSDAVRPPPRALVVDDEFAVRTVLVRWLQRRGWEVDQARNGKQALDLLGEGNNYRDRSYDLLICDLRMPEINGMQLYKWVADHRPELQGHVIFSSGDVNEPQAAEFLRDTGCEVLEKPFELAVLAELVAKYAA